MKVACEGCGAKYAVPEDKIQGSNRTFKVTCRQCSEPIVIQGIGGGSEAKWYFAVGRDRRGPVDDATIASHLSDGTVTPESLAWCQGMAGWEPLSTISGLAHLLGGEHGDQTEPEDISNDTTLVSRTELEAAHAAMDTVEESEGSPAESAPAPTEGSMLDDLFDQGSPLDPSAPMHERADTSVLFSLDDLAKSTNNPLPGVTFEPGQGGEYSGLIDVRATKTRSGNRRRPLTQSPFDDAPAPTTRPAETAATTIAVPVIRRRSNTVPIVIAAVAVICGGAFAAMQMKSAPAPSANQPAAVPAATTSSAKPTPKAVDAQKNKPPTAAAKVNAAAAPAKVEANKAATKEAKPTAAAADNKEQADEAAPEKMTAAERRKQRRLERRERRREARANSSNTKARESKPEPTKAVVPKPEPKAAAAPEPPPPPKKTGPKKDVNALLATLNKNKAAESGGSPAAAAGSLPQRLSSSKLRSTLRRKRGTFGGCYKKMADRPAGGITVNTSLIVSGSGSVKSVRITSGGGASAGVLRCISSALKSTKFPPFAAAQMSVNYPITLR